MANSVFSVEFEVIHVGAGLTGDGSAGNPIVNSGTVPTVTADTVRLDQANHDCGLARSASGVVRFTDGGAGAGSLVASDVKGTTFHVGAAAGVDASIVIPAVATITVSKGIIVGVV